MKRYVRPITIIFLTIWALAMAATLYLYLRAQALGTLVTPDDKVAVTALRICGRTHVAGTEPDKLKICGSVASNKPVVTLDMYLYRMPGQILVSSNPADDRFSIGEFERELDLPDGEVSGQYLLLVYFYKNIVGTYQFDLASQ